VKIEKSLKCANIESVIGQIGKVWKSSQKVKKSNSCLGRVAVRDLNKINKKLIAL